NKGISLLAGRLTGNTTDTPTVATTKLDTVLTEIAAAKKVPNPDQISPANGAATIIRQLHDWFIAEQAAKATAQADLANANADLDKTLREQQKKIGQVAGPGPEGAQPLAVARAPVGRVLRALPGNSIVHIDLGRENHVSLGMNFAVYSSDRRVPESGRGKANI